MNNLAMVEFTGDIYSIENELEYLINRVKFYKETVSLTQLISLKESIQNIAGDYYNEDDVRDSRDEGISEANSYLASELRKMLDGYTTHKKLILQLNNLLEGLY